MIKHAKNKQLKQIQNQAQAGYMQSNELQITGGEAGKKNRIKTHSQDGRSMVEMIGVLAIIGVLSVGSLSGYEYATASYRAGQIRDALLAAKKSASVNTNDSHANEVQRLLKGYLSEYSVNVEADSEGQHPYQVQLKGVAPRTCTHLWEMKNVLSSFSIEMTSPESKNDCQLDNTSVDTVSMSFAFNALDNKTEGGSSEPSCADCKPGFCISGVCVECLTSADCEDSNQVCDEQAGRCTDDCSKGVCQTGHCINHRCGECAEPTPKWNGKNCVACPPSAPKWNGVDCEACPPNKPKWTDEGCVECPDNTTWDGVDCVSVSCEYPTPVQQGTTCVSCAEADTKKPKWNAEEHKCEACPEGTKWNTTVGDCVKSYECRINADCKPDEYCYMKEGSGDTEFVEGDATYNSGECRSVSDDLSTNVDLYTSSGYITYFESDKKMTWWSACRLCAAKAGQRDYDCTAGATASDFMASKSDISQQDAARMYNEGRAFVMYPQWLSASSSGEVYTWSFGRSTGLTFNNSNFNDSNYAFCKE